MFAVARMHGPSKFDGAEAHACRWDEAAHQMFHGNRTFMSGGFTSTSGSFCMQAHDQTSQWHLFATKACASCSTSYLQVQSCQSKVDLLLYAKGGIVN